MCCILFIFATLYIPLYNMIRVSEQQLSAVECSRGLPHPSSGAKTCERLRPASPTRSSPEKLLKQQSRNSPSEQHHIYLQLPALLEDPLLSPSLSFPSKNPSSYHRPRPHSPIRSRQPSRCPRLNPSHRPLHLNLNLHLPLSQQKTTTKPSPEKKCRNSSNAPPSRSAKPSAP